MPRSIRLRNAVRAGRARLPGSIGGSSSQALPSAGGVGPWGSGGIPRGGAVSPQASGVEDRAPGANADLPSRRSALGLFAGAAVAAPATALAAGPALASTDRKSVV